MINVLDLEVTGIAHALFGMRLAKNSTANSDTLVTYLKRHVGETDLKTTTVRLDDYFREPGHRGGVIIDVSIGDADKKLIKQLIRAGNSHCKFLRQMHVSMVVTGTISFWHDMDTYKVATTKTSESRMATIAQREVTLADFELDPIDGTKTGQYARNSIDDSIRKVNDMSHYLRVPNDVYNQYAVDGVVPCRKRELHQQIYSALPQSFKQTAAWTGSIATLRNYYFDRKNHQNKEMRDLAEAFANISNVGWMVTYDYYEVYDDIIKV